MHNRNQRPVANQRFGTSGGKALLLSFLVLLLIKIGEVEFLTTLEFAQSPESAGGHWASVNGDSFSYIGAMENYVTSGSYYFINEKGDTARAGRLPHYAVPYFLFRQIASPPVALDLFVLLQLVAESIAIVCLALLVFYLTRRKWCFLVSLFFSAISLYVTNWAYNTYTDSMSVSLIVIASFFYFRYLKKFPGKNFLLFSVALAIATCLRPYLALVYVVALLVELYPRKQPLRLLVQKSIVLAFPLVFLLTPWVVRNYQVLHRLVLFQQDMYAGYGPDEGELAIRRVLTAMGEVGGMWWDRKSAASFFDKKTVASSLYTYPAYLAKDREALTRLESLRALNLGNKDPDLIRTESEKFIAFYKSRFPLRFYVLNRLSLVTRFLFHNGSYRLPVDVKKPAHLALKAFQSLLYYLYLIPGFVGLILLARKEKHGLVFLFPTVYLMLLFPIVLGLTEWKYFLPFYCFHQIGLVYLLYHLAVRKTVERRRPVVQEQVAFRPDESRSGVPGT